MNALAIDAAPAVNDSPKLADANSIDGNSHRVLNVQGESELLCEALALWIESRYIVNVTTNDRDSSRERATPSESPKANRASLSSSASQPPSTHSPAAISITLVAAAPGAAGDVAPCTISVPIDAALTPQGLCAAVEAVLPGVRSRCVPDANVAGGMQNAELQARLARLSPREMSLLPLLARGLSLRDASTHLGVSYKTADACRTNVLRKLGLRDRVELARFAIRLGIIEA